MPGSTVYEFTPFRLVLAQRQLVRDGTPVKLGGRGFDVLVTLIERRDRTVSKNELMDLVWPTVVVEENNLEVQIVTLRKLLGYAAIATVPGRGYRFTLPVEQTGAVGMQPSDQHSSPVRKRIRSNLPRGLPILFGRDQDLQRLLSLLDTHGLVTVAGPAGIGKTRLAQAAAEVRTKSIGDGVWWVDLAPMSDPALIPNTLAVALGLNLGGASDGLNALMAALSDRSPLVLLDNAEHLLDGVASLVLRLQREVPGVRFLVTSQEPLRIDDEHVFRPEPLSLPSGDDPERIAASGAVALFVARAQAADRRFELCAENQTVVAEICRRLDGIPLAIELAAARVPLLGIEGLRDKLDQRFHVLTAGRRVSLRRHQTLRAALEWSHQLLSAHEQAVFRRLGTFVGGFTLDAAQEVASDSDEVDQWDVLEHLGALVEKSLVVAEEDSHPRYRMLETTRLFALECLIESAEVGTVRRRHRDHFLRLAERCDETIITDSARAVLTRLDQERDNLMVAMKWSVNEEDAQLGLHLACAMGRYWFARGMASTGAALTALALSRPATEAAGRPARCRALVTAGWLSMWEAGKEEEAVKLLEDALDLAKKLNDKTTLCHVLTKFAEVRHNQRELHSSLSLSEEALEIGRDLGDSVELGDALVLRGRVARRAGDFHLARELFLEALQLRKRMRNAVGTVSAMLHLSGLDLDEGNTESARSHLESAAATSVVGSNTMAMRVIRLTADYAAAMGREEAAVYFDSAFAGQLKRTGLRHWLAPDELQQFATATSSVRGSRRQALVEEGASIDFEESLQRAKTFLAHGRWSN